MKWSIKALNLPNSSKNRLLLLKQSLKISFSACLSKLTCVFRTFYLFGFILFCASVIFLLFPHCSLLGLFRSGGGVHADHISLFILILIFLRWIYLPHLLSNFISEHFYCLFDSLILLPAEGWRAFLSNFLPIILLALISFEIYLYFAWFHIASLFF